MYALYRYLLFDWEDSGWHSFLMCSVTTACLTSISAQLSNHSGNCSVTQRKKKKAMKMDLGSLWQESGAGGVEAPTPVEKVRHTGVEKLSEHCLQSPLQSLQGQVCQAAAWAPAPKAAKHPCIDSCLCAEILLSCRTLNRGTDLAMMRGRAAIRWVLCKSLESCQITWIFAHHQSRVLVIVVRCVCILPSVFPASL